MKLDRRRGRLVLRLHPAEVAMLRSLFDELDALLLAEPDPDDPVLQRLFPAAHPGDDAASEEFRELTEDSLRGERTDRTALCRAELEASTDVDLAEPEAATRWIQTLNDLRLALGTRLEIGADGDDEDADLDPADPDTQPLLIYHWLTMVQDSVVTALMR